MSGNESDTVAEWATQHGRAQVGCGRMNTHSSWHNESSSSVWACNSAGVRESVLAFALSRVLLHALSMGGPKTCAGAGADIRVGTRRGQDSVGMECSADSELHAYVGCVVLC